MPDERLGASFSIDINQLQSGLRTANKLIRESKSEFKAAAAGMDDWSKSEAGLKAKIQSLNQIVEVQEQKVKALADNYEQELADGMDETSDRAIYLRTQLNNEEAALESSKQEIKKNEQALQSLGDEAEDAGDSAQQAKEGFTVFKGVLSNLITDVLRRAIDLLKELAKQTIETGANFEAAMSQVAAVSGATSEELDQLTAKAEEMGAKTKFSATESAEAFNYMAMAGWKTEDMLGGIEGIMNLAAASGADLATTSDIVTDALTAMGYAASDAGRLADVMAAASSNANTNVEMMGQTFQYAAPIVGALGYSMEDTAVQIGLMANAGIKGEKAGTALRSILTRLSAPPKECADAMEALGVSMTDSSGKMKSLDTVMADLRTAFSKMSETEQTANAKHIAGQEAMSGLLAIVNAAPTDFKKLKKAVESSSGAAQKMSDTMNDNVKGAFTIFKSQVEGVQIALYNHLEPALRSAIKEASNMVGSVNWEGFGNKVKKALDKVMDGLQWLIKNGSKVVTGLKLIVAAFAISKVLSFTKALSDTSKGFLAMVKSAALATTATNVNTAAEAANTAGKVTATGATGALTVATNLLNAAWKANPIGIVITALTALVGVIAVASKKTEQLTEAEQAHKEALEEQKSQLESNRQSWDDLVQSQQGAINVGMTEVTQLQSLWGELQKVTDENGKVKAGYEERANFIAGELSNQLGIEIELNNGIIKGYQGIQAEIDKTIEKKRAQTVLESQEQLYTEAINKKADAYKGVQTAQAEYSKSLEQLNKSQDAWNKAREEGYSRANATEIYNLQQSMEANKKKVAEAEKNLQQQTDLYNEYLYNIGNYERNYTLFHNNQFSEMSTATWEYVQEYQSSGEAMKAQTEANIAQLEYDLNTAEQKFKDSGDVVYKTIADNKRKQLAEERDKLNQYKSVTDSGLKATEIVWNNNLDKTLSAITGKNVKFKDAGNGQVQMLVDGQKVGAPKSKKEMAKIADEAITEVAKKTPEYKKSGENYLNGLKNGINNGNIQSGILSGLGSLANRMLNKLKSSLKEHSPSRATAEMGEFLVKGLGVGIDETSGWIFNKISDFGDDVLDDFMDVFDIHSPSKRMADSVGKNIALGIVEGVNKQKTKTKRSAEELSKQYVKAAKDKASILEKKNKITVQGEIDLWKEILKHTKKGTSGYKEAHKQLATAQKTYRQQSLKYEQQYSKDVLKVEDNLIKNIQKVVDTYDQAVSQRTENIKSQFSFFDGFQSNTKKSAAGVIKNMQSQVDAINRWDSALDKLASRKGVTKELVADLQELGINETANIELLANMSDSELKKYVSLWKERNSLAKERALQENADLEISTRKQVAKLVNSANKDLNKLEKTYMKNMGTLQDKTEDKSKSIGKHIVSGLMQGIKSKNKDLQKYLTDFFGSITNTAKKALKIHSPSQVMKDVIGKNIALGIVKGFDENIKGLNASVNAISGDVSGAVGTGMNRSSGGISSNKNVVINQTNNYSQQHSRYELYKSKQQTAAAVRLALGTI